MGVGRRAAESAPARYRPRRPSRSVLYRCDQEHLETWLAQCRDILVHLGEPTAPPRIAPARGPPLWEAADAGTGDFDSHAQPAPADAFDQRIAW